MTIPSRFLCASAALMSMAFTACREQSPLVGGPEFAPALAAAGKPPSTIPVGMTIKDTDAAGTLRLTRSDNPAAGAASYSGGVITSTGGAFQWYIGNQSTRTLWPMLATQGMSIADGYYYSNVEMFAQCYTSATGTTLANLTAMSNGASNGNCSFGVDFSTGGVKYKLVMGQVYANTGRTIVTCTAQGAAGAGAPAGVLFPRPALRIPASPDCSSTRRTVHWCPSETTTTPTRSTSRAEDTAPTEPDPSTRAAQRLARLEHDAAQMRTWLSQRAYALASAGHRLRTGTRAPRHHGATLAAHRRHAQLPDPLYDKSATPATPAVFTPRDFAYDADARTCPCPAGKSLYCEGRSTVTNGVVGEHFRGAKRDCVPCTKHIRPA